MLVQLHGGNGGCGMTIIRRRYGHRIEMLVLLVQHLAEILVIFRLGILLDGSRRLTVIDIAEIGDIHLPAAVKIPEVVMALSAGANGGNRQPVTGSKEPPAKNMPWHDKKTRGRHRGAAQEFPAGCLQLAG